MSCRYGTLGRLFQMTRAAIRADTTSVSTIEWLRETAVSEIPCRALLLGVHIPSLVADPSAT